MRNGLIILLGIGTLAAASLALEGARSEPEQDEAGVRGETLAGSAQAGDRDERMAKTMSKVQARSSVNVRASSKASSSAHSSASAGATAGASGSGAECTSESVATTVVDGKRVTVRQARRSSGGDAECSTEAHLDSPGDKKDEKND